MKKTKSKQEQNLTIMVGEENKTSLTCKIENKQKISLRIKSKTPNTSHKK
jgi:hypothetical protein